MRTSRLRTDGGGRRKTVGAAELTLMTLGGIIGSGLFLASGQAIRYAGPGVAIGFLIGALAMSLEIAAFAEMAAADPATGSFIDYSRKALGPMAAFVGGWIFWFSSVLNLAAEATAGAIFTRLWLPGLPIWLISVAYALAIIAVNLLPVKGFGKVEAAMAGIKVAAIAAFILGAAVLMLHGGHALAWGQGGFLPHGARGVAQAMVLVTFSMAGTGVLGLAAAHVRRPEHNVAEALHRSVSAIFVLYVASALAITAIMPYAAVPTEKRSPFVAALAHFAPGWAQTGFNLVILIAVLSAMNAGLFATDRVLVALSRAGDAPRALAKLSSHGTPVRANLVTGLLLALAALLAYVLPKQAFLYLVTATGFQALLIWLLIVVTHIFFRRHLLRERGPSHVRVRVPWFPYASWFEVALLLGIMATAVITPRELLPLGLGLAAALIAAGAYALVRPRRRTA